MALSLLFGRKKSPADLVKSIKESLAVMDKRRDEKAEKARAEITTSLNAMKVILYGSGEKGSEPDAAASAELAMEFLQHDMPVILIGNLARFDFDGRRLAAQVFNGVMERAVGSRLVLVDYVVQHPDLMFTLLANYDQPDLALACGSMLRECLKHEPLARLLLFSESFFHLARHVENTNFEISSDAFATMRKLLLVHKAMVAEFLERAYDKTIAMFTDMMNSSNYMTKRESLKLLGELLLDRQNFATMTKYVSSVENLKLIMNLLRDESKIVQFEAFHIFKVFVANPNKPQPIKDILLRNQSKLITFLQTFLTERNDDDNFMDEKQLLMDEIAKLTP